MPTEPQDLAQIRFDNALALFDEFVRATVKHPDAATLRGLDGRFAERLLIQPSYWSHSKASSRQMGERLARQFEQRCHKPAGWLDQPPAPARRPAAADAPAGDGGGSSVRVVGRLDHAPPAPAAAPPAAAERLTGGLAPTSSRRPPGRARARVLELLGEALQAPAPAS